MKFAKVMFSQVSVCPTGGACVVGGALPGRGLCGRGAVHGRGGCMAGETATAAGATHPTEMHSCFFDFFYFINLIEKNK